MANAKKCDRCNEYFELAKIGTADSEPTRISTSRESELRDFVNLKRYDICPVCKESFHKWLKEKLDNDTD